MYEPPEANNHRFLYIVRLSRWSCRAVVELKAGDFLMGITGKDVEWMSKMSFLLIQTVGNAWLATKNKGSGFYSLVYHSISWIVAMEDYTHTNTVTWPIVSVILVYSFVDYYISVNNYVCESVASFLLFCTDSFM